MGSAAPKTPQDVLELLRVEVERKFGAKAAFGVPTRLTGKDAKTVRDVVLNTFPTEGVIALVRLLVWDWEVARETCYPPRSYPIPTIESLVRYIDDLSSRLSTGFVYQGSLRGSVNTYSDIFLKGYDIEDDDDPY